MSVPNQKNLQDSVASDMDDDLLVAAHGKLNQILRHVLQEQNKQGQLQGSMGADTEQGNLITGMLRTSEGSSKKRCFEDPAAL